MVQGKVIRLVTTRVSDDVVQALEELLEQARAGKVTGIAYVAMRTVGDYYVDLAGETRRCPSPTRGMLALLDDELSQIIRGE